jgi:hypothetical protein
LVSKSILSKIEPITEKEKCFVSSINKIKSYELDSHVLTMSFLNENTSFPEASSFACAAISWLEALALDYQKFESRSQSICKTDEESFLNYCKDKNWSVKRTSKDLFARTEDKFRAKFEFSSGSVFMFLKEDSPLEKIKIVNEILGGAGCSM